MNQPLRGMKDFLPENQSKYLYISNTCSHVAEKFCYKEISTPILEPSEVFNKTLGNQTDIIQKETYNFIDKSQNSVTLRPEGTASVVRFVLNEKLYQSLPLRFFYRGPMFRYERPQKGRLRQFHQAGVECFGLDQAEAELEVIELAQMILESLKILNKSKLIINTLGDKESQQTYKEKLIQYLTPYKKDLSEESQIRLEKNPLRILDSKSEKDKKILTNAPSSFNSLNKKSLQFFDSVLSLLDQRRIAYEKQKLLVRGLDYYTHTVFEYTHSELGSQNTLIAGGRYDSLVEDSGGPSLPAIGWALGIERLMLISQEDKKSSKNLFSVLYSENSLKNESLNLAYLLRSHDLNVYLPSISSLNFSKELKKCDKNKVDYVLILGSDEWKENKIILKNMKKGSQEKIDKKKIIHALLKLP